VIRWRRIRRSSGYVEYKFRLMEERRRQEEVRERYESNLDEMKLEMADLTSRIRGEQMNPLEGGELVNYGGGGKENEEMYM